MEKESLKWYERSRPDDGHVEQVWLAKVTAKQLAEINVGDWIEGFGDVNSLAVQEFIRKYGFLLFKLKDDSQWDATDAAHPAFWRGLEYSCHQAVRLIADVLSGKDIGEGVMNEPCATMRNSVLELKQKFDQVCQRVHELEEENGALFEKLRLAEESLG